MKLNILLALSLILFCASAVGEEKEKSNNQADAEEESADTNWQSAEIDSPSLYSCKIMQQALIFMVIWAMVAVTMYPFFVDTSIETYVLCVETRGRRGVRAGRTYIGPDNWTRAITLM